MVVMEYFFTGNKSVRLFLLPIFFFSSFGWLKAQDTVKTQSVQIVSNYKPLLRPSTKLSFSASPIPPAPFTDALKYQLPDQQFRVMMKPAAMVPAEFKADSFPFLNHHFLKLGYGNFRRVYADAGTSWGTGKPVQVQLMAGHHSLKGNLNFQQNNRTYADAFMQVFRNNHRFHAKASLQQRNYYYYGFDTSNINAKKDSLRQTFNQYSVDFNLNNNKPNAFGLSYRPSLHVNIFNDRSSNEINAMLDLPFSVEINESASFSLSLNTDLTRYAPQDTSAFVNNIYSIYPSFRFPVKSINFDIGGKLAWDQGDLNFLPLLGLEAAIVDNNAIFIAGWKSSIQKNNYQQLTSVNPWIRQPLVQLNTRKDELFAGLRGSLPLNLHYRVLAGVTQFRNLPLFLNLKQMSVFDVVHERSLRTFHVRGSLDWIRSEKLNARVEADIYQVLGQQVEDKPWHFIPVQVNFYTSWQPVKNLMLQAQLFGWRGAFAKTDPSGSFKRLSNVVDANMEADFRLNKLFRLWMQLNNIFNRSYERWYGYPVVGLQVVGGIRLTFERNQ